MNDGVATVLLEMTSGAMLGCLLLFLRRPSMEPDGLPLLLGAIAGGVVGFAVGLAYRKKNDVADKSDTHLFEETLCARNSSPAIGK